mmetsp:Transcript_1934/g.4295  ORF Transcript_1934/g.4295 Transcript_1934/m.4295 type:complete len:120 (-) Transcript_1934:2439-2798(-)
MQEVIASYQRVLEGHLPIEEQNCEWILCRFLWEHSRHSDLTLYTDLVRLVCALHLYLEEKVEPNYCKKNDALLIPLVSSQFLKWLETRAVVTVQADHALEHLCQWLYVHGFTHLKMKKT